MNTSDLKNYAPAARRDFIRTVTDRANLLGLSKQGAEPIEVKGDVALIGGRPYPAKVASQRKGLEERIDAEGFQHVMEAMAYTWFNRFAALRYMELHGYLEHGFRVLSHPNGSVIPEILEHATDLDLPGLDRDKVIALKLEGNQDAELYRLLLVAQCNALASAMPFLFERIDDETELLLPDNLLHSDSLIRKLVTGIDEASWQQIEIIGWLYQFYISEKKDQVIGKVVASEDIPAATQLFTPNWIVKYMVQNSLGAQWLATYPDSKLKAQMEYYIEPAEQTPEVGAALAAITPSSLNPEELTFIDPACGSGHILVEAYELFKAIYLERGYRLRDVPQLILEKNLYGLDIDERAAQLTGFALMMKARADDRRLFERGVKLNVMVLVDSADFDSERLTQGVNLAEYGLKQNDLTELKQIFKHATTFGSLIQVPEELAKKLPALKQLNGATSLDLFISDALKQLGPLVQQAELLAAQYDAVVVNPPYIGSKYQTPLLKKFADEHFAISRSDFFAMFIERAIGQTKDRGRIGVVAPFVWMFLSSYEKLRELVLRSTSIASLIQLEYNAFEPACIPVATFSLMRSCVQIYKASYIRLSDFKGHENQAPKTLEAISEPSCGWLYTASPERFSRIPGKPLAYWASEALSDAFDHGIPLGDVAAAKQGLATADNGRFLRRWHEVSSEKSKLDSANCESAKSSGAKWFPHSKGGGFRRWYGNNEWFINWKNDGEALRRFDRAVIRNPADYFKGGVTWCDLTSSLFNARRVGLGFVFDTTGPTAVLSKYEDTSVLHAFMNSVPFQRLVSLFLQGMHYSNGIIAQVPVLQELLSNKFVERLESSLVTIATLDWNAYERSWDFQSLPILSVSTDPATTLETSYNTWITQNLSAIAEMERLEEENNRLFIDAYGLQDELTPEVPIEQITLTVNPAYRYGGNLTEAEQWDRFRQDSMQELVSYAIGCMMGRYSLDEPGLIYAHAGNVDFDATRYKTFPADADGIVPITDEPWFEDDAANRVREFMRVAWGAETLDENLAWLAESLGKKGSETPMETLRRHLADKFFKDHLQTYKKRPIYWLFSSGKQQAFQCLVYLHRYNEVTLSRMRAEYVTPLQGKLAARVTNLQSDIEAAPSTAARNKLQKRLDAAKKKQTELAAFDDLLRHYADQRISLDLDDGVKVNYGRFGNLLAEIKTVTGGSEDD